MTTELTKADQIAHINTLLPPCVTVLGGELTDFDRDQSTCEMRFEVTEQFCHSGNVVQGGNVTVMLDAAMAHAVFATLGGFVGLPSLEIKVSFLAPTLAGPATAHGRVVKLGRSIAFLEGSLFNSEGELAATATSTAKVIRSK